MSSAITLSAATRQNLLSLQDTASLAATNQNRLSTGKKVNSALDNPVNFFTAQSLSDRSSALSGLLDGISNGIQTIQAANTGASKIADLVKSLQSTITQAQSDAAANRPTVTGGALATAAEAKLTGTSLRTTAMSLALGGTAVRPSDTSAGSLGIAGAKVAITRRRVCKPEAMLSTRRRPEAVPSTVNGRSCREAGKPRQHDGHGEVAGRIAPTIGSRWAFMRSKRTR